MTVQPEQLAKALLERHEAELVSERRRAEELRAQLALLAPALPATGVWLVGSLETRFWGAGSDVDVVVEGLARNDHTDAWQRLEAALGETVDLLRIEDLESSFAERVRREGTRLV